MLINKQPQDLKTTLERFHKNLKNYLKKVSQEFKKTIYLQTKTSSQNQIMYKYELSSHSNYTTYQLKLMKNNCLAVAVLHYPVYLFNFSRAAKLLLLSK